ncbi:MAG TPA: hypothetical protein VGB85_01005 [Nannocystis sp.]|jgi:hypothetical protein
MNRHARKIPLGAAALSLLLALPGCGKKNDADTVSPGAERGGAGADGNNSTPDSLTNGEAAPDPDTTSVTEPTDAGGSAVNGATDTPH